MIALKGLFLSPDCSARCASLPATQLTTFGTCAVQGLGLRIEIRGSGRRHCIDCSVHCGSLPAA